MRQLYHKYEQNHFPVIIAVNGNIFVFIPSKLSHGLQIHAFVVAVRLHGVVLNSSSAHSDGQLPLSALYPHKYEKSMTSRLCVSNYLLFSTPTFYWLIHFMTWKIDCISHFVSFQIVLCLFQLK